MALNLRLQQKMTQQMRMTPQMVQAINLLQMNHLELAETIVEEMAQNPILEEGEQGDVSADNFDTSVKQVDESAGPATELNTEQAEVLADMQTTLGDVTIPEPSAKEVEKDIDWDAYVDTYSYSLPPSTGAADSDLPSYEATLSRPDSLQDDLRRQVRLLGLEPEQEAIAMLIIEELQPSGYLHPDTAAAIAESTEQSLASVDEVLLLLQRLEPIGVCATSVKECLLIQCEYHCPEETLLPILIERFLPQLERKSYQKIVNELEIEMGDIARALKILATFNPKPGSSFSDTAAQYVTPDIFLRKIGEEWAISLNEDGIPRVRISDQYFQAMTGSDDQTKSYLQDKLKSATWLIRSIHMRQRTIYKVMESILKFQPDFFAKGKEHLKPLVLRDIAEDIEMSESTVSRVTTNKYVQCPQGLFELKYFFNASISRAGQEDIASESVREHIKRLIDDEDPKKPLSDQKLVDLLGTKGIKVARRTVAKYRDIMNIPSSSRRKQVF